MLLPQALKTVIFLARKGYGPSKLWTVWDSEVLAPGPPPLALWPAGGYRRPQVVRRRARAKATADAMHVFLSLLAAACVSSLQTSITLDDSAGPARPFHGIGGLCRSPRIPSIDA